MKLDDRIAAVASAASGFSWLGELTTENISALDRVGARPIFEQSRASKPMEDNIALSCR